MRIKAEDYSFKSIIKAQSGIALLFSINYAYLHMFLTAGCTLFPKDTEG